MSSDDWFSIELLQTNNKAAASNLNASVSSSNNNNNSFYDMTNNSTLSDSPASTGTPTPLPAPAQFLTWCFFVLFCFLCRPSIPDASFRIAQRAREREERLAELRKDPQVRKRAMDQGLITKRVISCDDKANLTLGDLDGSVSVSGEDQHSVHSTDPNTSTCSICLDAFHIGDTVTWSRSNVCRHVFHTDCLMEWLTNPKHEDCPSCRAQIIDLERQANEESLTTSMPPEPSGGRYMVMDGLIRIVTRQASWIAGDLDGTTTTTTLMEPTRLQIAFRRVSSGIYSHLSQTFDLEDDLSSTASTDELKLKRPVKLRRVVSEGVRQNGSGGMFRFPATRRISSRVYSHLSKSGSSFVDDDSTDIESQLHHQSLGSSFETNSSDPMNLRPTLRRTLSDGPSPNRRNVPEVPVASRPGLFVTRVFRRSSSGIQKIIGTFEEDDEDELEFCDTSWREEEDSVRLQSPTILFCDNNDLELGQ